MLVATSQSKFVWFHADIRFFGEMMQEILHYPALLHYGSCYFRQWSSRWQHGSGSATLLKTHLTKQERGGRLVPSSLAMASQSSPPIDKKNRIRTDRHNFEGSVSHNTDKKDVRTVTDKIMPFLILYKRSRVLELRIQTRDKINFF